MLICWGRLGLAGGNHVAMRKRRFTRLAFLPGMVMVGGTLGTIPGALAQTSFTSFTPTNNNSSDTAVAATTQGSERAQGNAITGTIQSHIRDIVRGIVRGTQTGALEGGPTGLAAGSGPTRFGAWADVSGSYLENTAGGAFSYSGWSVTGTGGFYATLGDSWVLGISAGRTGSDFNVPSLSNGTRTNYGNFIGPYISYIINPHFSVDGSFLYTNLTNEVRTLSVPPNFRHFGSNRYTYALNANYYRDIGPISFTGFTGYTYSYDHQRGFADSSGAQFTTASVRYGAWKIGFEVAYPIGNFEPYLPFTYEHQTTQVVDGTSRDAVEIGLGLRYRLGDSLKLGIAYTSEHVRDHQSDDTIGANLRFSF